MTISSTTRKAGPYTGNSSATSFAFAFKVFAKADIEVKLTVLSTGAISTLTLDTDYTVTLNADQNANPGGTVTYNPSGVPMPSTKTLTITSVVAATQGTDITNGGGFYPDVLEDMADRATIGVQQNAEAIARSIQFPIVDAALTSTLPTAALRANKAIVFDASGNVGVSTEDFNDQGATAAAASAVAAAASESAAAASESAASASAAAAAASAGTLGGITITATAAGTTTLTSASTQTQQFTGTSTQDCVLPVASTLLAGRWFRIINDSTGIVTVKSSGGNTVRAVAAGETVVVLLLVASGTSAASWSTPQAGVFTTITASGDVVIGSGYGTTASTGANYKNLFVGAASFQGNTASGGAYMNANLDGAGKAIYTGGATFYEQSSGAHKWWAVASTTAGVAPTLGLKLSLDASGLLMKAALPIGYGTGAGAAVTQATDKSTGVTINAPTGAITMNAATLNAGTKVYFVVTNSFVANDDTVLLTLEGASISGSSYRVWVDYLYAGHFVVALENYSGSNLSQAAVINFAVIKAVST